MDLAALLRLFALGQADPAHAWPPGPLAAVCTLALLLQQPDQETHLIALENMRGRFNLALGVGSAGFSEGMVCSIPEIAPA